MEMLILSAVQAESSVKLFELSRLVLWKTSFLLLKKKNL